MKAQKRPFLSTLFWTVLGRVGGLLIPFVLAYVFGAARVSDVFFYAYGCIFVLINIFTHVLGSALVPLLVQKQKTPSQMIGLANAVLKASFPWVFVYAILIYAFMVTPFFSSGQDPEFLQMSAQMFLEMIPGLLICITISKYEGLFISHKNFWFAVGSPLIRSLTMIIFLVFFHQSLHMHALSLGFLAGEILRWAAAEYLLGQIGLKKVKAEAVPSAEVKSFYEQVFYQVLALSAINLMYVADQWAASRLGVGQVSLYNYGDRLVQIPNLLFFNGILSVFLPYWSESYQQESRASFWNKIKKDALWVFAAALGLTVILFLGRNFIVRCFFFKSKMNAEELAVVSEIFGWLVVNFIPGIMRILYSRVLFVLNQSKWYGIQSAIELGVKIALNIMLVGIMGIRGIAVSTLIVYSMTAVVLFFYFEHLSFKKN